MTKLRILFVSTVGMAVLGFGLTPSNAGDVVAGKRPALLVRDADNPARNAVQGEAWVPMAEGETSVSAGFPQVEGAGFPLGKRLVIEHITFEVRVPAGQKVKANLQIPLGAWIFGHHLVMTSQGVFGGEEVYTASQETRWYADKSITLTDPEGVFTTHIDVQRSSGVGTGNVVATIQGHFEDRD